MRASASRVVVEAENGMASECSAVRNAVEGESGIGSHLYVRKWEVAVSETS